MSIFDQRGQQVNYQYNAAGDINFGATQNRIDVVREMEKLKAEVVKAAQAQVVEAEVATDAEYQLTKAIQHATKPEPNKKTILDHLNEAKALIGGVTALGAMVPALVQAAEAVQKLF